MTAEFDKLIDFDPLNEAESLTGKSYKEDESTAALGTFLHLEKMKEVQMEMALRDDFHYSISWKDSLRILNELGFEEIYSKSFNRELCGFLYNDCYKIFWKDGVLLTHESFRNSEVVNRTQFYFNWIPDDGDIPPRSSGHFFFPHERSSEGRVWIGNKLIFEGLRNDLQVMESTGEFLETWVESPRLRLIPESVEVDFEEGRRLTGEVISELPEKVQKSILPVETEY